MASVWLATGLGTPSSIAVDASRVYWIDTSDLSINSVAKTGGPVAKLAETQYDLTLYDERLGTDGTYVYWVAHGIWRALGDGTGAPEAVTDATGTALTVIAPNVYFYASSEIESVPASGGTPTVFVAHPSVAVEDGPSGTFSDMTTDGSALYALEGQYLVDYGPSGAVASTAYLFSGNGQLVIQFGNVYVGGFFEGFVTAYPQGTTAVAPFPCAGGSVATASAGGLMFIEGTGNTGLAPTTATLIGGGVSPVAMIHDGQTLFWTDRSGAIGHLAAH
jgi:hypothetical protein